MAREDYLSRSYSRMHMANSSYSPSKILANSLTLLQYDMSELSFDVENIETIVFLKKTLHVFVRIFCQCI